MIGHLSSVDLSMWACTFDCRSRLEVDADPFGIQHKLLQVLPIVDVFEICTTHSSSYRRFELPIAISSQTYQARRLLLVAAVQAGENAKRQSRFGEVPSSLFLVASKPVNFRKARKDQEIRELVEFHRFSGVKLLSGQEPLASFCMLYSAANQFVVRFVPLKHLRGIATGLR
jgi:hypothetical protein